MSISSKLLPQTLIARVFLLYSVAILLLSGAGLSLWATHTYKVSLNNAQDTAATFLSLLGPTSAESAVIGDYDTIGRILEKTVQHPALSGAMFIDIKGARIDRQKNDGKKHTAPDRLANTIAAELVDVNMPVNLGGKDYGILRLQFDTHVVADELWSQALAASGMTVSALLAGCLLVWFPLRYWLGNLNRIRQFGEQMKVSGGDLTQMLAPDAPLEFRKTFEVLNQAATSLQLEREQAAVTLSAIADGVATVNAQGHIVLTNPVLARMLGKTPAQLLGKTIQGVLPGLLDAMPASGAWQTRIKLRNSGGTETVLDLNRSPIGTQDEQVGWVMAFRDVSVAQGLEDRLRSELQAREQAMQSIHLLLENFADDSASSTDQHADVMDIEALVKMTSDLTDKLRERGDQLAAIFALSPDGFVSFDARHKVHYVSPAFTKLTGVSSASALGLHENVLLPLMLKEASPQHQALSFSALRGHKQKIDVSRPARRVLELAAHTAASGSISQVLHVKDVTYEVEVEQMKSEFLSTAAHELRTPITSVFGFTELMMTRELSPDKQKSMLERIHRQSTAMITILNELLDLSRIEARRGKDFDIEALSLKDLIHEAIQDFQQPDGRTPPDLTLLADMDTVNADRSKLLQVIRNLLSNAYKYSPNGGPVALRIYIPADEDAHATPSNLRICMAFKDHGIGMTPDQLSHMTERFYRADTSGAIPGTGLGMSIVKEIIELHGGQLTIESNYGVGTEVTVTLPLITT
ncbi:MAG: ATP-binding protein [Aquabacterium sp.]|nr:ATP-binding protein [Aquabacterium sp.]